MKSMASKLPSKSQARALRFYVDHGDDGLAAAESWSAYNASDDQQLDWYNHQRTLQSLLRRGWVNEEDKITETGLNALIEFVAASNASISGQKP
jgi:hypothetical protein